MTTQKRASLASVCLASVVGLMLTVSTGFAAPGDRGMGDNEPVKKVGAYKHHNANKASKHDKAKKVGAYKHHKNG